MSRNTRAFLLLSSALLLAACAAESPPRPPRIQRPVAVRDLSAHQVGATIELRFTLPTDATDGESLTKPLEVNIFRSALRPGEKTALAAVGGPVAAGGPTAAGNVSPWVVLEGRDLMRHTAGGTVLYADQLSPVDFKRFAGGTLTYDVTSLTRGFRGRAVVSEPSNRAKLALLDVAQPVMGLSVRPTAKALDLSWQAPSETVTGQPAGTADSYRIYRRDAGTGNAGKPASYRPIGVAHETSYADSDFEFGHLYSYRVRALLSKHGSTAESADSQPVEILPKDVFPPSTPTGLTGLYTSAAVELIWSPNLEPDLAGYNVYRREAGRPAVRMNSELVRSAIYRDRTATLGHHYFYDVTAVDLTGNESAPSAEVEVEVR